MLDARSRTESSPSAEQSDALIGHCAPRRRRLKRLRVTLSTDRAFAGWQCLQSEPSASVFRDAVDVIAMRRQRSQFFRRCVRFASGRRRQKTLAPLASPVAPVHQLWPSICPFPSPCIVNTRPPRPSPFSLILADCVSILALRLVRAIVVCARMAHSASAAPRATCSVNVADVQPPMGEC